jgi:hypothetical protein
MVQDIDRDNGEWMRSVGIYDYYMYISMFCANMNARLYYCTGTTNGIMHECCVGMQ